MRIARLTLVTLAGAALLLAPGAAGGATPRVEIYPNASYIGETTQELAYREFEHSAGSISIHLDAKRRIDGFTLRWICTGNRFSRMTYVTALDEPPFDPVPLRGRAFSFKRELPWYDYDPGRESRTGTAEIKVSGQFFKRGLKPRRRSYPLPLTRSSIAKGTVSIVDGNCRVRARWEFNRDNTRRNQGIKSF